MKQKFILIMLVLISLISTTYTYGQQGSAFDSLKIIPANPTSNDEINLVCYTSFPTGPCELSHSSFDVQGNEINFMFNYEVGDFAAICNSVDTINIGKLPPGDYKLSSFLTVNLLTNILDEDSVHFTVDNPVSIKESFHTKKIEIYPNPFSDELIIVSDNADLNSIEVYSIIGKKVLQQEINSITKINVSSLANGIYIAVFTDKKGKQLTKKIVKNTL